jgi:hypothetical protein
MTLPSRKNFKIHQTAQLAHLLLPRHLKPMLLQKQKSQFLLMLCIKSVFCRFILNHEKIIYRKNFPNTTINVSQNVIEETKTKIFQEQNY